MIFFSTDFSLVAPILFDIDYPYAKVGKTGGNKIKNDNGDFVLAWWD